LVHQACRLQGVETKLEPNMTRKDYTRIAAAFKAAKAKINEVEGDDAITLTDGVDYAVGYVAEALHADNPSFDVEEFLLAVGA
jgi:hypothetical protein